MSLTFCFGEFMIFFFFITQKSPLIGCHFKLGLAYRLQAFGRSGWCLIYPGTNLCALLSVLNIVNTQEMLAKSWIGSFYFIFLEQTAMWSVEKWTLCHKDSKAPLFVLKPKLAEDWNSSQKPLNLSLQIFIPEEQKSTLMFVRAYVICIFLLCVYYFNRNAYLTKRIAEFKAWKDVT